PGGTSSSGVHMRGAIISFLDPELAVVRLRGEHHAPVAAVLLPAGKESRVHPGPQRARIMDPAAFSPANRAVYEHITPTTDQIYIVGFGGSNPHPVFSCPGGGSRGFGGDACWWPDGQWIAFELGQ